MDECYQKEKSRFLADYLQYNFRSQKNKKTLFTLSVSHTFFNLCRIWNLKLFKTEDPSATVTNIATNEDNSVIIIFFLKRRPGYIISTSDFPA